MAKRTYVVSRGDESWSLETKEAAERKIRELIRYTRVFYGAKWTITLNTVERRAVLQFSRTGAVVGATEQDYTISSKAFGWSEDGKEFKSNRQLYKTEKST